eukprot:TRINITY_DN67709_c2_g1_i1.p1 TRINITY_DN67709_c2_g1~~TRINITY_DN67709_c2_g1_i1.p1  ORF type:complete len:248 (+),score=11.43 TRINITY_DN67709_c2_g1_i1:26-769(+)
MPPKKLYLQLYKQLLRKATYIETEHAKWCRYLPLNWLPHINFPADLEGKRRRTILYQGQVPVSNLIKTEFRNPLPPNKNAGDTLSVAFQALKFLQQVVALADKCKPIFQKKPDYQLKVGDVVKNRRTQEVGVVVKRHPFCQQSREWIDYNRVNEDWLLSPWYDILVESHMQFVRHGAECNHLEKLDRREVRHRQVSEFFEPWTASRGYIVKKEMLPATADSGPWDYLETESNTDTAQQEGNDTKDPQ